MIEVSVSWCSSNGAWRSGGIEDDLQRLDIEVDQVGRILSNIWIGSEDSRYRFADISHVTLCQCGLPVGLKLHSPVRRKSDRRNVSDIGMGPDGMDARQGKSGFCIDRFQSPMRDRRAHHAHMPLAGKRDIACKAALAGEERAILQARDGTADKFLFSRHERNRSPFLHLFGRGADRLDDVLIAGATAEIR